MCAQLLQPSVQEAPLLGSQEREQQMEGAWQGWSEAHTSRPAWGAEQTLRGLTSPGKTPVRPETHRQAQPAWRSGLTLLPLSHGEQLASTEKTPGDAGLSSRAVRLLPSLTGVKPRPAVPTSSPL